MDPIVIRGAREHNLKNISLEIPRNRLVVITGVSGSGKSSLALDTLYVEGQRRYIESLSPYVRQILSQRARPDVDSIEGLSPAIALEAKGLSSNPRSTVGTVTEIYDHLRLLFARLGAPFCPKCGQEVRAQSVAQVVDQIMHLPKESRLHVLAPLKPAGDCRKELEELRRAGFVRVEVDGSLHSLEEDLESLAFKTLDLLVDRLILRPGIEKRVADSLETALRYGGHIAKVKVLEGKEWSFSPKPICASCRISLPEPTPSLFSFNHPEGACPLCRGLGSEAEEEIHPRPCPACQGKRLRPESLLFCLEGKNIAQVAALPLKEALTFVTSLSFSPPQAEIASPILKGIRERLELLLHAGLGYLTLDRPLATLSRGEAQRLRLATQLGLGLSGILYILDEPSVGLHPRDNEKLLSILRQLQARGNSIVVVEHDREIISAADFVIDMGPGAGEAGGKIVALGSPQEIQAHPHSLTGRYLRGELTVPCPSPHHRENHGWLHIRGARHHNLKNISLAIPLGRLTCVTGVSGSGKSSLVLDVLYAHLASLLHGRKTPCGEVDEIRGWESLRRVLQVDQTPLGRTPRSNPAIYTGLLTPLRELFAQLPEARLRGYTAERFSFNSKGGRCEACGGEGVRAVEMLFLPDLYVTCEACQGRRYNRETLTVKYRGLSIADVLDLTVDQALEVLGHIPALHSRLETLREVGLGYLRLGQPAPTLSAGEAQRVKLARELSRRQAGPTLYILDEPTTGLHMADVARLLGVLRKLVDEGHTVVVIEHQLDIVGAADFVVDLGPEAGEEGGNIVVMGTPEKVANCPQSHTGRFLKTYIQSQSRVDSRQEKT